MEIQFGGADSVLLFKFLKGIVSVCVIPVAPNSAAFLLAEWRDWAPCGVPPPTNEGLDQHDIPVGPATWWTQVRSGGNPQRHSAITSNTGHQGFRHNFFWEPLCDRWACILYTIVSGMKKMNKFAVKHFMWIQIFVEIFKFMCHFGAILVQYLTQYQYGWWLSECLDSLSQATTGHILHTCLEAACMHYPHILFPNLGPYIS